MKANLNKSLVGNLSSHKSYRLPPNTQNRKGLPILVVDDSKTQRTLHKGLLESANHEVTLAVNAEDALLKLAHGQYAAVVTDHDMGEGRNGVELAFYAKQLGGGIPVVLVSSNGAAIQAELTEHHPTILPFIDLILTKNDPAQLAGAVSDLISR